MSNLSFHYRETRRDRRVPASDARRKVTFALGCLAVGLILFVLAVGLPDIVAAIQP